MLKYDSAVCRNTLRPSDVFIFCRVDIQSGRNAATDAAFHRDEIGLDTDAAVKLNCDEAEGEKM